MQGRGRLLLVGTFASSWAGTVPVCEALASHLEERGWSVLRTSDKQPRAQRLLDMLWTTWHARNAYDIAIVEVYSGPAFVWAEAVCQLLRILGKPYVLSLHGGNLPRFATTHERRVGRLFAGSAAIVAQSGYLAGTVKDPRHPVRLIPNPLDLHLYTPKGLVDPGPRLVWLRSFHRIYNPSLAVEVVARLRHEFPELVLTMIGRDQGDGSLHTAQTLAERLGVQGNIVFQGAVPKKDVPLWLSQADVFLNTTDIDNTPVSVEEAMACGLCVVSTNVGGVPFLIEDGVDGLLVPPADPEAMAAAVRRVLTEPGLGRRLSQAGRRKVERMDWLHAIEAWEHLLHSLPGLASADPTDGEVKERADT